MTPRRKVTAVLLMGLGVAAVLIWLGFVLANLYLVLLAFLFLALLARTAPPL